MTSDDLLKLLKSLDLPTEDYAVFGSGPMYIHGLKDIGHDIDLIARDLAWEKAKELGKTEEMRLNKGEVITLFNGAIEIFNTWTSSNWNIDELIDTAEIIDGIRWVKLENVLKWKKEMSREKDLEHIKLIEKYLSTTF